MICKMGVVVQISPGFLHYAKIHLEQAVIPVCQCLGVQSVKFGFNTYLNRKKRALLLGARASLGLCLCLGRLIPFVCLLQCLKIHLLVSHTDNQPK